MITSITLGLLLSTNLYAHKPCEEIDPCDINSIVYLEDEAEIELGFDTADYLPEDFDPYTFYFDINTVEFMEDDEFNVDLTQYLPTDFNAYAHPKDFRSVSYIDPEDSIEPILEGPGNLHGGFDAYISK